MKIVKSLLILLFLRNAHDEESFIALVLLTYQYGVCTRWYRFKEESYI